MIPDTMNVLSPQYGNTAIDTGHGWCLDEEHADLLAKKGGLTYLFEPEPPYVYLSF